jgi:hypothetical protein
LARSQRSTRPRATTCQQTQHNPALRRRGTLCPDRGGDRMAQTDRINLKAGEYSAIATRPGTTNQKAKTASDDLPKRISHRCGQGHQQARPTRKPNSSGTTSPGHRSRNIPPARRANGDLHARQSRNDPSILAAPRRLATGSQPARRRRVSSPQSEPNCPYLSTLRLFPIKAFPSAQLFIVLQRRHLFTPGNCRSVLRRTCYGKAQFCDLTSWPSL